MKAIWKFPLPDLADTILVQMPDGSRILSVQMQNSPGTAGDLPTPMVWALVDTDAPWVKRRLICHGTGHPISYVEMGLPFIGTFQMYGGRLVFHLFDGGVEV